MKVFNKENELEILARLAFDTIQKTVVGAVVLHPSDKSFLAVTRTQDDFMGGLVELPSGGVEPGEGLLDALKREIFEETALEIGDSVNILPHFDYISGSGKRARQVNFLCKARTGDFVLDPREHQAGRWIALSESGISNSGVSAETKEVLMEALHELDRS